MKLSEMRSEGRFRLGYWRKLPERSFFGPTCSRALDDSADYGEFSPPKSRSFSLFKIVLVSALALVLIVASVTVIIPHLRSSQSGPPQLWHSFAGVFINYQPLSTNPNSLLASTDCNLTSAQIITEGLLSHAAIDPNVPIVCSFQSQTYQGIIGTDCNLSPTGVIPSINGSQIPYNGCVLSYAPLSYIFSGLFNAKSTATNTSIAVFSNHVIIANITTTSTWRNYGCSMVSDDQNKTNGPISCFYLGIPYSAINLATSCSFKAPVLANGVEIPQGGCVLQRSEQPS